MRIYNVRADGSISRGGIEAWYDGPFTVWEPSSIGSVRLIFESDADFPTPPLRLPDGVLPDIPGVADHAVMEISTRTLSPGRYQHSVNVRLCFRLRDDLRIDEECACDWRMRELLYS